MGHGCYNYIVAQWAIWDIWLAVYVALDHGASRVIIQEQREGKKEARGVKERGGRDSIKKCKQERERERLAAPLLVPVCCCSSASCCCCCCCCCYCGCCWEYVATMFRYMFWICFSFFPFCFRQLSPLLVLSYEWRTGPLSLILSLWTVSRCRGKCLVDYKTENGINHHLPMGRPKKEGVEVRCIPACCLLFTWSKSSWKEVTNV